MLNGYQIARGRLQFETSRNELLKSWIFTSTLHPSGRKVSTLAENFAELPHKEQLTCWQSIRFRKGWPNNPHRPQFPPRASAESWAEASATSKLGFFKFTHHIWGVQTPNTRKLLLFVNYWKIFWVSVTFFYVLVFFCWIFVPIEALLSLGSQWQMTFRFLPKGGNLLY